MHKVDWNTVLMCNPPKYKCSCGFTGYKKVCTDHLTEMNKKRVSASNPPAT